MIVNIGLHYAPDRAAAGVLVESLRSKGREAEIRNCHIGMDVATDAPLSEIKPMMKKLGLELDTIIPVIPRRRKGTWVYEKDNYHYVVNGVRIARVFIQHVLNSYDRWAVTSDHTIDEPCRRHFQIHNQPEFKNRKHAMGEVENYFKNR